MSEERIESVWIGKDAPLLDVMLNFYAPEAAHIVDVCCNARRMWNGSVSAHKVKFYDNDPSVSPDVVCSWEDMPDGDNSVDVLVYDPPHLPLAAISEHSSAKTYQSGYGLNQVARGHDNIAYMHTAFLKEANRVLKSDGLIFCKIKDYIHNHKYQWNLQALNAAVLAEGLTPCDLIIKRDPCAGNLKSSKWKKAHHAKNVHCYWLVVRKGKCERKSSVINHQESGEKK